LKHYHPKYVRTSESGDALEHPKVGALFKKGKNGENTFKLNSESVRWGDRDDLRDELEDTLINTLERAGIPTDAPTSFVADDPSIDLDRAASALDLSVTVTDPKFTDDHPATAAFNAGEAKEGVGMGGALALADRTGLPMDDVRGGLLEVYDRLFEGTDQEAPKP
jgi:hypothetical protein